MLNTVQAKKAMVQVQMMEAFRKKMAQLHYQGFDMREIRHAKVRNIKRGRKNGKHSTRSY